MVGIAAICLRALSDLFSPNLIDQSNCIMIGQLDWKKIDLTGFSNTWWLCYSGTEKRKHSLIYSK